MEFLRVVRAAFVRSSDNLATLLSAGVSFYFFLSLVPALIAAVSIYGIVLTPEHLPTLSSRVNDLIPTAVTELLLAQFERLSSTPTASLGVTAAIGALVALWGASSGIAHLLSAVNAMHDDTVRRPFWQTRLIALGLTIGAGVTFVVLVGLVSAGQWGRGLLGDDALSTAVFQLLRYLLLATLLTGSMVVILGTAPYRPLRRRWWHIGVPVSTAGWVAVSFGFSMWADTFGRYSTLWGALAGVVVLLLWLWIGIWAILFGACVQATTAERTTGTSPPAGPSAPPRRIRTGV